MRHFPRLALTSLLALAAAAVPWQGRADEPSRFARWEKEIAAFEAQDKTQPPPRHGILFVGSSSIRRWDLSKSFPDLKLINRGFGGSELADSVHFAPRIILKHEPRLVVLYAGDNDIAAGKSPQRVFADFQAFVQQVRKSLPNTRIIFLSIKPSIRRWQLVEKMRQANGLIEAYCKQQGPVQYLDVGTPLLDKDGKPRPELFARDGLHLNDKGYAVWAAVLKPKLK